MQSILKSKTQILPYFMGAIVAFMLSFTAISCGGKDDPVVPENPTAARDKFLGTYSVTKGCTILGITTGDYSNITSGAANNAIVIDGNINATVSGSNFTIIKQTISGTVLSGSGALNGKTMTMTLTLTQGTSSSSCALTFEKQ
jgi:hypothetical protein